MQKSYSTTNARNNKSIEDLNFSKNNISSNKKSRISQQALEIDHQIAKCLDTLDRQGLKYLRQTLKTSNIFNSTALQTGDSPPLQSIEIQSSSHEIKNQNQKKTNFQKKNMKIQTKPNKRTNSRTRISSQKKLQVIDRKHQTIEMRQKNKQPQIKKIENKNQQQTIRPIQPSTNQKNVKKIIIENTKTHEKIGLGEKLKKEMLLHNISRVGPTKNPKKNSPIKSSSKKSTIQVEQPQIEEQIETVEEQIIQQQQIMVKKQEPPKHIPERERILTPEIPIKLKERSNPLKYSHKSISHEKVQHSQQQYWTNQSKGGSLPIQQKALKQQDERIDQKISQSIEVDHQNQDMSMIIQKIVKLSPTKLNQLQKVLQAIEHEPSDQFQTNPRSESGVTTYSQTLNQNDDKLQGTESLIKNLNKNDSFFGQTSSNQKKASTFIDNDHFKKSKKFQKTEKATSFHMKSASRSRIKIDSSITQEPDKLQVQSNVKQSYDTSHKHKQYIRNINLETNSVNILEEGKVLRMEKIQFETGLITHNKQQTNKIQLNDPKIQKKGEPISEVKMMNLNSKRTVKNTVDERTNIKFKIISNFGHNSLFGLTGIQIYTIFGQRIEIGEKQINENQGSTFKLLRLFNNKNLTIDQSNMLVQTLDKNQISVALDKQNSKIGGIRIFNYNKSSLESDKQIKQLQIYHNGTKIWKGQLKRGIYNDYENYSTEIQILLGFQFPKMQIIIPNKNIPIASKSKQQSWIEKSQVQKKIKQLQRQEQQYIENNRNFKRHSVAQLTKNPGVQLNKASAVNLGTKNQFQNYSISKDQFKSSNRDSKPPKNKFNKQSPNQFSVDSKPNQNQSNQKNDFNKNFQPLRGQTEKKSDYSEFDTMLRGLQTDLQRNKSKSKLTYQTSTSNIPKNEIKKEQPKKIPYPTFQNDSFMNDSMFQQKPKHSRLSGENKKISPKKIIQQKIVDSVENGKESSLEKKKNINIDQLLGQLDDVMGKDGRKKINLNQKQFKIPNLPQGDNVEVEIYENWGHPAFVGLHGIQFFDSEGNNLVPIKIQSNKCNDSSILAKLVNNKSLMNHDERTQTKLGFDKGKATIMFKFDSKKIFALIRIWNYNGQRIHSNIGIKLCLLKINSSNVFLGQIRKSESAPQHLHKFCQSILFTSNFKIITSIKQKDWLTELKLKIKLQKKLFKSTLTNFNRPSTRNEDKIVDSKKQVKLQPREIKLSKRACWQYEPPELPKGDILTLILHDTFGDNNFIGLNGLQVFNDKGQNIVKDGLIKAFPNSTGQANEKRIVQNLINGQNISGLDKDIWLAMFQNDLEKLDSGNPNTIVIQFKRYVTISGINFYNYSKTPDRGVHEIEIQLNGVILFRGYLRMFEFNLEVPVHTTINFTKDQVLLQKMNYNGYNEDNSNQNVSLINEKKKIKV